MAVYLVSLRRLGGWCGPRPTHETSGSDAKRGRLPYTLKGEASGEVDEPSGVVRVGEGSGLSSSIQSLLNLPESKIEASLRECGESGSKLLLALIYRLAAVETQLADLSTCVRGQTPPPSKPDSTHVIQEHVHDAGKSDLLQQVFRKNLSLRRKMD